MAGVPWWVSCSPLHGQGAVPQDPRSGSTERPSEASDFLGQPRPDVGVEAASWSGEPGSQQAEAVGPQVAPGPGIRRCPLTARALPGPISPNTQDPLPGLSAGSILPRVWPTSGAGPSLLRRLLLRQHPGEEWWPPAGQAPPAQVPDMARWWKAPAWAISTPDPPVTFREACLTPVCGSWSCPSVPSPPALGGKGCPPGLLWVHGVCARLWILGPGRSRVPRPPAHLSHLGSGSGTELDWPPVAAATASALSGPPGLPPEPQRPGAASLPDLLFHAPRPKLIWA